MQGLLIANKNRTERDKLASIFSDDAYQVSSYASVVEGLEKIINKTIQVIVLAGDFDEQHIVKLVPLLKKCNRHLSIILVTAELPLTLLRKIRKEGVFYHALPPVGEIGCEEIHQVVSCAFKTYQANVNAPNTLTFKEKTMLNAKSIFTTLSIILLSVPAMAADTTKVYTSGILVLLFVGFCALIVVAQLLPAVMNLMGMTKKAAQNAKKMQTSSLEKN
ncbi:response regulator [Malonomonas rubra]|uniref:response regulator n=1 Tax=Malonomonas rubra TaxID=57040 RepID=UPI0026EDF35F|nr:response regulator [Malonomonas rubra]